MCDVGLDFSKSKSRFVTSALILKKSTRVKSADVCFLVKLQKLGMMSAKTTLDCSIHFGSCRKNLLLHDRSLLIWHILTDISCAEQHICEFLIPLLKSHAVGDSIVASTDYGDGFAPFEWFFPQILNELYPAWKYESLDGIYPASFCKTGDREIELVGVALFMSDQTLTPFRVCLGLSQKYDCVSWIDLKLGEYINGKCRRDPYGSSKANTAMVLERLQSIEWYYHVGYGERET